MVLSINDTKPQQPRPEPQPIMVGFTNRYLRKMNIPTVTTNNIPQPIQTYYNPRTIIQSQPEPSKMVWGEPTWLLFHTLSQKIHEIHFKEVRAELLDIIYKICVSLPCPICSTHAKQYLDGINFNTIQSKQQLQQLLFNFHNKVNEKKGIIAFSYSDLDVKYSKAITINIINNFLGVFMKNSKNIRLLSDDLQRQRLTVFLKNWFQNHIGMFD
jgi:hypothetical protein